VQRDGVCFAGGSRWRRRWVIVPVGSSCSTTDADVDLAARSIIKAWRLIQKNANA
jgi:hypothetical protein